MMLIPYESEADVRACYCGVAIATMCRVVIKKETDEEAVSWGFDRSRLVDYIMNKCKTPQGGFGFEGNPESHSGLTYCAVASLKMLGVELEAHVWLEIVDFCLMRQNGGFQGRCNKLPDACYSFWNKATLKILLTMRPKEVFAEEL
jgi:prenyltransferase beta subunit